MRVLLNTWSWPTDMHHLVPLAWALNAAGHEVRMASQPVLRELVSQAGVTAVAIGDDVDLLSPAARARAAGGTGTGQRPVPGSAADYRRLWTATTTRIEMLAEAMVPGLVEFIRAWQPDLVIWDWMTFAASIAARRTGIPSARLMYGPDLLTRLGQEQDAAQPGTARVWTRALYSRYGAEPGPGAWGETWCIDPCPASAQLDGLDGVPMRYLPYSGPSVAPAWTADEPAGTRVCVTMGTSARTIAGQDSVSLPELITEMAGLDAGVIVAGTAAQRAALPEPLPGNVTFAEMVPLHAFVGTCSAIVHQGGIGTTMTAARYGVPQVIVPAVMDQPFNAECFAATGSCVTLPAQSTSMEQICATVWQVLDDDKYRDAAGRLREEFTARPAPSEVAETLAGLAAGWPGRPAWN